MSSRTLVISLSALLLAFSAGCATAGRRNDAAAESQRPAEAADASSTAAPAAQTADGKPAEEKPDPEEEKRKSEKERKDLARKLEKTQRELEAAQQRLMRARMSIELAEIQNKTHLDKAREELTLAERKLKTFMEKSKVERVSRAELGLQYAQDSAKEAQEELTQLEMMYNEDQFADKTKEIVLERGRRRLERSQRNLQIEGEALATLKGETLPVEQIEQELALREKKETLERMPKEQEAAMLDLRVGLMGAEADVLRLQGEIEDVQWETAEFEIKQKKKAEEAKKAASAPASTAK